VGSIGGYRLASVHAFEVVSRYPRTVGRNARLGAHGDGPTSTAVAVTTDDGTTGWGLALGPVEPARALVGRPIDELIDPSIGLVEETARTLDYALHDLAGMILGLPVHEMLGGAGERVLDCYDGAIYLDDLDVTPELAIDTVLANCAADHAAGYRSFKLKIGRGHRWMDGAAGLARDIEVTRAVRAAYPDADLLADANDGFTIADALEYLQAVQDCGLFWLEEPFLENRADLTRLRGFLRDTAAPTLVADGEARQDVAALLPLAADGLIDVLLMDVVSYGLTAWRKIMPAVLDAGVAASPHAWGDPLKTLYAAQIGAGLGNVLTVEAVPGTAVGVDTGGYLLDSGRLQVPMTAGFGIPLPDGALPD
jgi:D-galactarolactone cycloisomerase